MPSFHLAAEAMIDRPLEQVRAFFSDVNSPVLWDRSVSKVITESSGPITVGARFTTIGPSRGGREGKRSDYRVVAIDGDESKAALENSPIFKSAVWTLRLLAKDKGTRVTCEIDMTMSWRHAPIGLLLALNKKAIVADLQFLKRAIEHGEVAKR
jgi:Polyketide cyclase / dehydrase and lipid transport